MNPKDKAWAWNQRSTSRKVSTWTAQPKYSRALRRQSQAYQPMAHGQPLRNRKTASLTRHGMQQTGSIRGHRTATLFHTRGFPFSLHSEITKQMNRYAKNSPNTLDGCPWNGKTPRYAMQKARFRLTKEHLSPGKTPPFNAVKAVNQALKSRSRAAGS